MSATATASLVETPPELEPWPGWGQSLYTGGAGIALRHIQHAHTSGDWTPAHRWVRAITRAPITADPATTGLHHGAPAIGFVLHTARHPAYQRLLARLDDHVAVITHTRLTAAHDRIDRGQPPTVEEYDLIRGLTGLGVYLLAAHHPLLSAVLDYLVRLTQPLAIEGARLPGWWSTPGPDQHPDRRNAGHADLGVAHGIAGPLALLSTALRRGEQVPGHAEAIETICGWLDICKQRSGACAWWPAILTATEQRTGRLTQPGPQRPSWCYGTPGLARAQQLAGLALDDPGRIRIAEQALAGCLTDRAQLTQLAEPGLCHGQAGLMVATLRVAEDSRTPELFTPPGASRHNATGPHLLEGQAGTDLAHHTLVTHPPALGGDWDACLLLS
jgi:hypothetical protein